MIEELQSGDYVKLREGGEKNKSENKMPKKKDWMEKWIETLNKGLKKAFSHLIRILSFFVAILIILDYFFPTLTDFLKTDIWGLVAGIILLLLSMFLRN